MSAHVVILGCGRSGTSIFGELFEHLPPYRDRYHFEPHFDELRSIDFSAGPVAIKIPKLQPGHIMTPGLPFVLEELLHLVPQPRVIFWQVRHPLDAICSLRPGITAGWKHNPKPADWVAWMGKPVIQQCARHWQNINETGYLAVKDIATVTRYEDLVSDPRGFAQTVCDAIGLDATAHATGIETWVASVGNAKSRESYEAKRQDHWSRHDHAKRVDRWRENLRPEESVAVRPIVEAAARLHGYQLPETEAATDIRNPEKSLIIHAGFHKTGTTSIQRFLQENIEILRSFRIAFYQGEYFRNNHVEIHAAAMRPERESPFKSADKFRLTEEFSGRLAASLAKFVSSADCDRFVVSAEGISLLRYDDELVRLMGLLPACSLTFVFYVREVKGWLRSYADEIQRFASNDERDAFNYVESDSWILDFDARLEKFRKVFGRESVNVIDYDKAVREDGSVIPSFLDQLGVRELFEDNDWSSIWENRTEKSRL